MRLLAGVPTADGESVKRRQMAYLVAADDDRRTMATASMGGGGGSVKAAGGVRTVDGRYATAKTSVWWDIENCHVPRLCDPYVIAQNISSALAAMGYLGPVTISAYGDTSKVNSSVQKALSSTGVSLNHVPSGVKDACDKKMLVDMLFWAVDNPPPGNYLLISGDRDFSNALHQLRMRRYNILLAQPRKASQALTCAAEVVWLWTDLLTGSPPFSLPSQSNENGISAEANRNSIIEVTRSDDPLPASSNLAYQKIDVNGNVNLIKGTEQVRRIQILTNTSKSRTAFNGSMQSHSGNQSSLSMGQTNQKSTATMSKTEVLLDAHDNHSGDIPFISPPSTIKISQNSKGLLKSEEKQFDAPHEFFGSAKARTSMEDIPNTTSKVLPDAHNDLSGYNPSIYQAPPMKAPCSSYGLQKSEEKQFNAPHEFFVAAKTNSSKEPIPNNAVLSHPLFPPNNDVILPNNFSIQSPSHPLNPLVAIPSGPYQQLGNLPSLSSPIINPYPQSTCHSASVSMKPSPRLSAPEISAHLSWSSATKLVSTRPNDPTITLGLPPILPNTCKHNSVQCTNAFHHNTSYPEEGNASDTMLPIKQENIQGNDDSQSIPGSSVVQSQMDNILRALRILKEEKIPPTEANIADCIHYGEVNIQDLDVRKALELAIQNNVIVMHNLGGNYFFIGKGDLLWKCVNVKNTEIRYPKAVWDAVLMFISSAEGHTYLMASRCMYEAASILKWSCLSSHALGEVLQILNTTIQRKWILPHSSGWQPLSVLLPATGASNMNGESQFY